MKKLGFFSASHAAFRLIIIEGYIKDLEELEMFYLI